jgi:hypothetical protein
MRTFLALAILAAMPLNMNIALAILALLLPALRRAPSLLCGLGPTVPFRPLSAHRRVKGRQSS